MKIERLEWDSDFFGINIGKLTIHDELDFDPQLFKQRSKDEKFDLVYVFKLQNMLTFDNVFKAGLNLVDIQLTMSKNFNKTDYLDKEYKFKTELTEKERLECYKIAEEISTVSRFYTEIKIGSNKTKQMYHKWIDNALNSSFSDGLFLVKEMDKVVGIHLIKTDELKKVGHCSIIGVDSSFKGRNIGKKLWEQSFGYWANNGNIELCKVPFSIQNNESFNFHLKIGFNKIEEIKYIYHYQNL
jgi:dTDP-4-amino-4,6-dideoxy-D-galactose acyltransferase